MKKLYRRRGVMRYCGWITMCVACALFLASGIRGYAARTGTVSVESARVRQEASTDAELVGSLASGDTVDVIGETESGGSTWYNVSFTQDGQEVTGWLRSDLLTVTGTDDTEAPAETEEPVSESPAPSYTVQEPAEAYTDAASLVQTTIDVNGQSYTAYQANADTALYLVYAAAPDGSAGWYWYDPAQGTFQQDLGQFGSQGLVTALQNELTSLKESSASSLSMRLYIIIGLGVLSVVLLVLVIVFAIRSRNAEYEYYDDDEDEDEEPEDDEKPSRKGGLFSKRRQKEDEEDDFDDFLAAVNERRSRDKDYADEDEDYEDYQEDGEDTEEKPDLSLTANLPQIDMSAVEEVEKKAGKAKAGKETPAEDSDDDDFDIEILDLDDFNL